MKRKGFFCFLTLAVGAGLTLGLFSHAVGAEPAKVYRDLSGQQVTVLDATNYKELMFPANHARGFIRDKNASKDLPRFRDTFALIPRAQWAQLIQEGQGTFLSDLVKAAGIPAKDQDGLNYCWCFASVSSLETERAAQGQPFVALSPESIGGPLTNWRNVGGDGLTALQQLTTAGCCANSFMDAPNSLRPNRWTAGWKLDCANHKITSAITTIDDGDFAACMTAGFMRLPLSVGISAWQHQVEMLDPVVMPDGTYGMLGRNSWGSSWGTDGFFIMTESVSRADEPSDAKYALIPSGSFACVSVTPSDKALARDLDLRPLVRSRASQTKARIEQFKGIHATAP